MNFPPAGTMCVDCGCCPANLYADPGENTAPVCWQCDGGEVCQGKQKQTAPTAEAVEPVKEQEEMTVESGRKQGVLIDATVKAAILKEPLTESHAALARKYGVTDVTVRKYRLDAGLIASAPKKDHPQKKTIERKLAAQSYADNGKDYHTVAPKPETKAIATEVTKAMVPIYIELNQKLADWIWQSFSLEDKCKAIQSTIQKKQEAL